MAPPRPRPPGGGDVDAPSPARPRGTRAGGAQSVSALQDATFHAIQRGRPGGQSGSDTPEPGRPGETGRPGDDVAGENGGLSSGGNDGAGLTDTDRVALDDYTGPGYRDMNSYLRNPDQFSAADQAAIQTRVDNVSEALGKLPPEPGVTFRGTNLPDDVLARYEPGHIVTEDAFMSTSRDPSVAQGAFDGNTLITVNGQNGRDVAPHSQFPGEAEILYDYGTDFIVTSKRWDPDLGKWLVTLEEVVQ